MNDATRAVRIPLQGARGNGYDALVDEADYEALARYQWYRFPGRNDISYAYREWREDGHARTQFMHSMLTGFARTDHANHDGLDNRRDNLRDGTGPLNQWNMRKVAKASSPFKGVVWSADKGKWQARITANGKTVFLGRWTSEERAARMYDEAARMLHGEYAVLNFPDLPPGAPDDELPPEVGHANADKTRCKRDHLFDEKNTYLFAGRGGQTYRMCRTCQRDGQRERRQQAGAKPRGSGGGYVADRESREIPGSLNEADAPSRAFIPHAAGGGT